MKSIRRSVALLAAFVLAGLAIAADVTTVTTAKGTIDKVGKDSLTVRPRGPDGKFEKAVVLKVTGTSRITTLTFQTRGGKQVPVQKDTALKDLEAKQAIAVIYTTGADGSILLAAVVLPAGD